MKKSRKTMITAAILTAAAAGLTGCTNPLASEEVQDVYGPPTDTSVSSTADINSEGTVDINDATALQSYFAEYEINYHIGKSVAA